MTKTEPKTDTDAEDNARAWMDDIVSMRDKVGKSDAARTEATERALSVDVRSGWTGIGQDMEPAEFQILLSCGGPALRITGDLDRWNKPENPKLEYQDWGTPWTRFCTTSEEDDALMTFCACFYFGEGGGK